MLLMVLLMDLGDQPPISGRRPALEHRPAIPLQQRLLRLVCQQRPEPAPAKLTDWVVVARAVLGVTEISARLSGRNSCTDWHSPHRTAVVVDPD